MRDRRDRNVSIPCVLLEHVLSSSEAFSNNALHERSGPADNTLSARPRTAAGESLLSCPARCLTLPLMFACDMSPGEATTSYAVGASVCKQSEVVLMKL